MTTPKTELLCEAADKLESPDPGISYRALRTLVADWMRAEAATLESLEPMAELINTTVEMKSGIKGYIRFSKTESGELDMRTDTSNFAEAIAKLVQP